MRQNIFEGDVTKEKMKEVLEQGKAIKVCDKASTVIPSAKCMSEV